MPELVTSVGAAMTGSPAIAWGNVVGSNIANSLLILGTTALVAPIAIAFDNRARDPAVALAASLALLVLAATGVGSIVVGLTLLACLIVYIGWCYSQMRRAAPAVAHNAPYDRAHALELADTALRREPNGWAKPILFTLLGLGVLIGGGRLLVTGAIDLARLAGLTEKLIGLTIVAVGTSLPELATSIIAARKGEAEVAFGNVVGSNSYNILGIGGATMLLAPGPVAIELLPLDIGLVAASALAILLLALVPRGVTRLPAFVLLALYVVYLGFLVANA